MHGTQKIISPEYVELNRRLHETSDEYGSGGSKWVHEVVRIRREIDYGSVLDYGCGKSGLAHALQGLDIREYDPAIKGKDFAPSPADLVVCTDVLEHVEPDKLDNVLLHLVFLTQKRLLFCVDTRPAQKTLDDGRNAHLTIENADWWKEKISKHFRIICFRDCEGKKVIGEGEPIRLLEAINGIPALTDDERNNNVRLNCASVQKRLDDAGTKEPHDRKAILVCYGPSLNDTWQDVFMAQQAGADVVTVSAAHKYMIARNVIPYAHIDCDPRERKARQFGKAHEGVKYWISSCVDPLYLEILQGFDVSLWHSHNGYASEFIWDYEPGSWMLIGGGSVGLRAISLLYSQGYRDIEIHGMDCSFRDERYRHAGEHLSPTPRFLNIRCEERWFVSTPSFVDYARQFQADKHLWKGAKLSLHGDGLLQYMEREAMKMKWPGLEAPQQKEAPHE